MKVYTICAYITLLYYVFHFTLYSRVGCFSPMYLKFFCFWFFSLYNFKAFNSKIWDIVLVLLIKVAESIQPFHSVADLVLNSSLQNYVYVLGEKTALNHFKVENL